MTKKILTVLLLAAILFTFASCIHTPDGDGEKEMKYSDIYKYTPSESEELSGKVTYKASYGYVGKQTQGYNNYYYEYLSDGEYLQMIYSDGKWQGEDAVISNGEMTSVEHSSAVRRFVAPADGEVTVSGNVKAVKGS